MEVQRRRVGTAENQLYTGENETRLVIEHTQRNSPLIHFLNVVMLEPTAQLPEHSDGQEPRYPLQTSGTDHTGPH